MASDKAKNLNMIHKILDDARNDEIRNLNRIKFHQEKKIASVNRLIAYKQEYETKDIKSFVSVVPALLTNKLEFIKKLDQAIAVETRQVEIFEHEKIAVIAKIDNLDSKLKAINVLIENNEKVKKIRDEEIAISDENEMAIQKLIKDKL